MDKILKIGMIGCGEISLANLKGIQSADNAKVVMAMDIDREMAESFADMAGTKPTIHIEDLMESDEIDAVFINTPHHLHAQLGIQAATHGKHVIVEKPLATTLEDAQKLIRNCRDRHVKLSVPYVYRYKYNAQKAKACIRRGDIGKIIGIDIHWISDKPDSYWEQGFTGRIRTEWRKSKVKSGGGILMMNCIHLFDAIDFITGLTPIEYLSQYDTYVTDVEVEDYFCGVIRYDNNAIGSIQAGSKMIGGRYPGEQRGIRFIGEYGQILVNDPDSFMIYTKKSVSGMNTNEWHIIQPFDKNDKEFEKYYKKDPGTLFIQEFADAVFADKDPPITGEMAYRSLETCIRLYEK